MLRTIRCRDCGSRFYASPETEVELCQNCTGDHDPVAQLKVDAAAVSKANDRPKGRQQSIDPRNPGASKETE